MHIRTGMTWREMKDTCLEEIGPHLQILITPLHSIVIIIRRTSVSS